MTIISISFSLSLSLSLSLQFFFSLFLYFILFLSLSSLIAQSARLRVLYHLEWDKNPYRFKDLGSAKYSFIAQPTGNKEYTDPLQERPGNDIKQSDDEAEVMLELWGIPSLPSLLGPLWPGVVASDRVLSIGLIELFDL